MMARTQIALDPEHHRLARERAASLGISLAEYMRTLVARDLAGKAPDVDPSAAFDLGDSGWADVARNKRAWVAEAVAARKGTRRGGRSGSRSRSRSGDGGRCAAPSTVNT